MSLHGSCSEADGGVEAEEMPDEAGGCDELGSRLEEELNRSIEKMREEEVAAVKSPVSTQSDIPVARLISLSDSLSSGGSPSGSTSPHSGDRFPHSSLELLQDVEMPNCNISSCDSTKQSISPTKNDSLEAGQQAVMEGSTQGCLDTAVLVVTSSPTSDDNLNDSVFIKENTHSPLSFSELLQDIEMPNFNLSSSEYSRLLSLPSNSPASMTHTGSHHHHAPADSSGELRATPAAPPGNTATLRDRAAVAEDKIKPRMLTLSPIKKMDLKEILLSRDNPGELDLSKLGSDTLSSSGVLGEAVVVLTELERQAANLTLSPQPSDRRFTVHPLDMEGINDSLLNSFQSSPQKPLPESSQDCPLPPVSKAEGTSESQGHRTAKENTIDRLTKLLGITTDQNTSTGDQGTTANPPQTEKNNCTFTPAETCANQTFNALSHPLKEGNPAINTTFDSKAPTKTADPSANTTFDSKAPAKTADPSANTTFDLNKQAAGSGNPTANTTFDLNQAAGKAHPSVNVTFDGKTQPAGKGNTAANTTFDLNNAAKGKTNSDTSSTFDCNKPATNSTFDKNTAAESEERPATTANTTFDFNKNQEGNGATNSTFSAQPESDKGELNVTFEKGEYRIGSQNETVNLMDAEENILQVILDATPKKISKQKPKASSTPKTTGNPQQPHLKAGLMKASTTNFLNRLLEGAKKEGQQESAAPTTTTATTTTSTITGMKLLDGAMLGGQQQQQQQRRQLRGRPGPMKALPLSVVVTNAAHLEAAAGGDSSGGTNGNGREALCQRRKVTVPSFGSLSSIESEMPSTPDCGINRNLSISSPEAFRMDILPCAPCITSTPTFTGRGVFTMMEMDGAIPTPISQVSSKPHFSRLVSSSSQPEGMSSGSLDKEQTHRISSSDEAKPKSPPYQPQPQPQPFPADTAPAPTAVTATAPADIAPQPPHPTPARPVEVDSTGRKETEESVEQQKPSTCSDVTQTVPPSPQAHPPPPPSSPVPPPPPLEVKQGTSPLRPSSPVPPAPGTTQTVSSQPLLEIAQPSLSSSSPSPSPSPTSAVAKEPSLPLPPSHTTMTGPSQAPPPLPTTSSSSSSSSSEPSPPPPPPPPEAKQPETSSSSPPPPTRTAAATAPVAAPAQSLAAPNKKSTTITKPQRKPLVSPSHTVKSRQSASVSPPSRITRPQKKVLASPPSTKSQSAPAPAARRDGNLKRPSTLVKPAMPKVRQVQPPNMSDKENRRRSSLSDITRQGPPQPAPPTKVERQSPLLSKRNPAPRLVLKPCNTNTKLVTSNPKVPSHVPALKGVPLKRNPQVETVGVASGKDKSNLRKSSPQPRIGLPRSSSGSKLPKTLNTSDSNLPSLKISSRSPNKPQGASQAPPSAPQARKSGLNLSGGTSAPASISIPPAKTSSAPQIKPNLTVRSSLALRQKPSLLKTPKPVL